MPYRRRGRTVYVYKSGRWRVLKVHKTVGKAIRHFLALLRNVEEA